MARLIFRFKKRRLQDGSHSPEPKIPVTYSTSHASLETMAYLDSGSTISYLPLELAEALGFKRETARTEKASGIGGAQEVGCFHTDIRLTRHSQSIRMNHIEMLVFLDPSIEYVIIGLSPFFEKHDVNFRLKSDRIEIRE